MMRTRVIRPGIATNEELAKLGPEAEVLFTRLWMMADREGRLEDRPGRIKAEGVPYYAWDVENLLEKLWKTGFIRRYKARVPGEFDGDRREIAVIEVLNFKKHQWIHASEAKSVLPGPPVNHSKPGPKKKGNLREVPATSGNLREDTTASPESHLVTSNLFSTTSNGGESRAREADPFPTDDPPTSPPNPKRRPPAQERGPSGERPRRKEAAVDWFPHSADTVEYVRESLRQLAEVLHRPEPDDDILRQVLDVTNGATKEHVHEVIRGLYHERKFANMRSWGLLPLAVAPWFRDRRAGVA